MISLKVPSIACDVCAQTITKAIKNSEPQATISVDVANKVVSVETEASVESIKKTIIEAGHTVEK